MRRYEITFITRSELTQDQLTEHFDTITKHLEACGGKIIDRYDWGPTALAYPIKRHKKGFYTTILFDGAQETVRKVEEKMRLNDLILRFLSVIVLPTQKSIFKDFKEKSHVSA